MKTKEQQAEEYAKQQKIKRTQGQSVAVCIKNEDLQYDAFIAGFEAATKWIPVDENTPQNVELFVMDDYGTVDVGEFIKGLYWGCYNPYVNTDNITHYLPIPKLLTK